MNVNLNNNLQIQKVEAANASDRSTIIGNLSGRQVKVENVKKYDNFIGFILNVLGFASKFNVGNEVYYFNKKSLDKRLKTEEPIQEKIETEKPIQEKTWTPAELIKILKKDEKLTPEEQKIVDENWHILGDEEVIPYLNKINIGSPVNIKSLSKHL